MTITIYRDHVDNNQAARSLAGFRAVDRDDGEVVTEQELRAVVESAFAVTGRGLARWPDPHPDRSPLEEEYSRVSDPAKWRLVGARADAWCRALVETGLADGGSVDTSRRLGDGAPSGGVSHGSRSCRTRRARSRCSSPAARSTSVDHAR